MERSPNKTNVEEIQPIFIANPKIEENGTVSKSICTQAKQNKKDIISTKEKKKKKPFHKKKKVNPTDNA